MKLSKPLSAHCYQTRWNQELRPIMSENIMKLTSRILQATEAPTAISDEKDMLATFSAVMSNILLFFLIFGLSATVRIQDLRHQLTNKFAIGAGVTMQFLFMPFLGFCSVMIFKDSGLTYAMGISLLVVTASPGGSYSNWWCSLFNAELALSVAMTSVSSILSLGLLPANLFFYSWLAYSVVLDHEGDDLDVVGSIDFNSIFITLGVVLGAIIGGLYVGYKHNSPHFHKRANHFGSICGITLIVFSAVLGGGGGDADTNFWSLPWSFYLATAFPCVLGMTLANIISRSVRLSPPEVVAISIECCYQNTAIATSVALTMFTDPNERAEAVSVPLFYGIIEAIIIGIYCVWAWKVGWTKAPADEKLCVVITTTYEVDADPEEENIWEGDLPAGWFPRLFVPREIERHHTIMPLVSSSKFGDKVGDDAPRDRFESADVTIATSSSTPPGTPECSMQALPRGSKRNRLPSDLEIQTETTGSLSYPTYKIDENVEGYPIDERSRSDLSVKAEQEPMECMNLPSRPSLVGEANIEDQPSNNKASEMEESSEN